MMRAVREVLRQREFRLLFLGQATSTVGDRLVFVALALYVTDIGSPSDVGLVLAAHALPLVAFVLVGGVWADRLPRHLVMVTTDLVRCGLHATLAALIFTGAVEIWHIVVIEALFGTAEAFFRPAQTGLLPQTVPEHLIQPARAASSTVETVAQFGGPALGTALVVGLGAGWAFAFDAATFLVSAGFLVRLRPRERGIAPERRSTVQELREGLDEVRSRAWVWVTVVVFSIALLTTLAPYMTLGPTIAEDEYGTAGIFGLLAAVGGAGTIVGSLIGLRWRPRHPMRAAMGATLPWPVAVIAFAVGIPLPLVIALVAVDGVGVALFAVWWETALAERVPPHALSRVSAYDWMGSLALLPLGYLLAGPAGEAFGATEVLIAGAAIGFLALVIGTSVRETWRLT